MEAGARGQGEEGDGGPEITFLISRLKLCVSLLFLPADEVREDEEGHPLGDLGVVRVPGVRAADRAVHLKFCSLEIKLNSNLLIKYFSPNVLFLQG